MKKVNLYTASLKTAMNFLKNYYESIKNTKAKYRGSNLRKFFCRMNKEKLKLYPFDKLYEDIEE